MNRSDRIRAITSAIVIALSLWFLWPTYRLATMSKEEQQRLEIENPEKIDKLHKKALKLGLDLKGGMHLTLEIDDSQLKADEKKDVLDRALEIVRNRVDQFGVSEPTIQKEGTKRIIVQLPGLTDPDRAKRLLGQTAMLEWRLIRQQHEVAGVLRKLDETFRSVSGDSLVEINPMKADTLGAVPDPAKSRPGGQGKTAGREPLRHDEGRRRASAQRAARDGRQDQAVHLAPRELQSRLGPGARGQRSPRAPDARASRGAGSRCRRTASSCGSTNG